MTKFDLLEQALIFNSTTVTGSQYLLNQEEVNSLIGLSDSSLSIVNQEFGLDIDLKTQTSLYQIQYKVSPLDLNGVEIEYGRTLNDMFSATPTISGAFITVNPTESGYSNPRYIRIKDSFLTTSGVVEQINVLNTDTEIVFGESGVLSNITLVGDITASTSDIVEIPITNSGIIPADIYVSLDPSANSENFSNFEIGLSATGVFYTFNEDLTIPDSIPWRLGYLDNLLISEDDKLKFNNPIQSDSLSVGSIIQFPGASLLDPVVEVNLIEIIDIDGSTKVARSSTDYSIQIIDPLFSTRRKSSIPVVHPAPSDNFEARNTKIAWDGGDYLYYLTGKADQSVYRYSISLNDFELFTTVTGFYNRRVRAVEIYENDLYILGGLSTAGTSSSTGNQLWKINLISKVQTQLAPFPGTMSIFQNYTAQQDNYIYLATRISPNNFFRYNITLNFWETLNNAPSPGSTNIRALVPDPNNNRLIYFNSENIMTAYSFNILSNSFSQITTLEDAYTGWVPTRASSAIGGSLLVVEQVSSVSLFDQRGASKVIGTLPLTPLATTSGTWTSPVIKVFQNDSNLYYEPYLDYNRQENIEINSIPSLGIETFEIRGSNSSPSVENSLQLFDVSLDPTEFFILNLDGSTATASGEALVLSHIPGDDPVNTSVVTFGFPLNTTGKMQYSFYYSPATDRLAGSTHYSRFYIAPFLDSLGVGDTPARNSDTLARTGNDYVYIEFGNSSDSGGVITAIKFYNGSLTSAAGVNLTAGSFYRLDLIINWDLGTYELLLDTTLILNGTIPFTQITKLAPQHTYEFFGAADTVSANEKYKSFYVIRNGNNITQDSNFAAFNINDTIFGVNGIDYNVVTLNNPVIPKTDYLQLRLVLRSFGGAEDLPVINSIKFPRILVLENVQPGETRSVFVRYNFPETDQSGSSTIYLKTWMRTDN